MNENELIRKLNSVGKAAFVEYFNVFQSYGDGCISKGECIEHLVSAGVSNDSGAAIRCSNAKLIFQSQMSSNALKLITESKRLSSDVMRQARKLIS